MNFNITIATPNDVEGMQDVFYQGWVTTYPNDEYGITKSDIDERWKHRHDPENIAKRKAYYANPPANETTLVAKVGDLVVGVCRLARHDDKNQLQALYILPEYQGQGAGTALWDHAQQYLDLNKDTVVHVAIYNEKAIRFYEKLGFVDNGKRFSDERFVMPSGTAIPEQEMVLKKAVRVPG